MLRFELIENTSDSVAYRYFPENKGLFGTISVRKSDKAITEQVIASNDEYKRYFFQMYKRIKQYIDADQYKNKGLIAWY